MSYTPKHMFWTYGPEYSGRTEFNDPRVVLARHTGWKKYHVPETDYCIPEPDNYNRAVFARLPIDCAMIEDQVIFYDQENQGWITLMYVPPEQLTAVDAWIQQCRPLANWIHLKAPKIKQRRGLLWTRDNISDSMQTDNERLYTMGYYEDLKVKYFNDDTEYVDSLLGTARAILKNPIPEELDEVDEF